MDVAPAMDFGFMSSPHRGSYNRSAPSSPSRVTEWYCGFDELLMAAGVDHRGSLATVPFAWEEKPGVPKTLMYEDDFSFDIVIHAFKKEEEKEGFLLLGYLQPEVEEQDLCLH
ncbi:hypothetical protein L1987_53357 [Smallanthus sonchifolius]|uniref:Uncharacterized protein n=1 Tax=Smallanthus sonchifolius TaxID=185202 RepID=A0ACB9EVS0_9ASTR|nr:hypothetical protein L1987_53357 [Smallanthus sonchifolius]